MRNQPRLRDFVERDNEKKTTWTWWSDRGCAGRALTDCSWTVAGRGRLGVWLSTLPFVGGLQGALDFSERQIASDLVHHSGAIGDDHATLRLGCQLVSVLHNPFDRSIIRIEASR